MRLQQCPKNANVRLSTNLHIDIDSGKQSRFSRSIVSFCSRSR